MKTLLLILAVWLSLSVIASTLFITRAWLDSRHDADDAAEEDSKP